MLDKLGLAESLIRGRAFDRAAIVVARVPQAHRDHSMRDLSMHSATPACASSRLRRSGGGVTTHFTWVHLPQRSIVGRYCCQQGQPPIADLR